MARIRSVKPEYPKHHKVRAVSRDARLLNIHLWNLADDDGRLRELLQWILGEIFPTDEDVTPAVLRGWLEELADARLIVRYEVDGERYIQCHDWDDHQKINKPTRSVLPPFEAASSALPEDSGSTPGKLPEDSRGEGKGRGGEKEGKGAAREAEPIPPKWATVCQALDRVCFSRDLPSPQVSAVVKACESFADRDHSLEIDKFEHYYVDGKGQNRGVGDVVARWRNWLETSPPAGATASAGGSPRSTVAADLAKLEAEHAEAKASEEAEALA